MVGGCTSTESLTLQYPPSVAVRFGGLYGQRSGKILDVQLYPIRQSVINKETAVTDVKNMDFS